MMLLLFQQWLCLQLFMIVFIVFLLLFVQCGFVNTLTVIQIYVGCNELCAHCFPRESMTLGSVAQTGNGKISANPPFLI